MIGGVKGGGAEGRSVSSGGLGGEGGVGGGVER